MGVQRYNLNRKEQGYKSTFSVELSNYLITPNSIATSLKAFIALSS